MEKVEPAAELCKLPLNHYKESVNCTTLIALTEASDKPECVHIRMYAHKHSHTHTTKHMPLPGLCCGFIGWSLAKAPGVPTETTCLFYVCLQCSSQQEWMCYHWVTTMCLTSWTVWPQTLQVHHVYEFDYTYCFKSSRLCCCYCCCCCCCRCRCFRQSANCLTATSTNHNKPSQLSGNVQSLLVFKFTSGFRQTMNDACL